MSHTAKSLLSAVMIAAVTLAIVACGKQGGDYGGGHPDYKTALAGAPAPLAALYAQADELLPGGTAAFRHRIAALHGHPVVVNKWASWCGPCRAEFPFFQRQAAKLGRRVAFLGVDSSDNDGSAKTFLRELPVPYPSYTDPDQQIAALLKATIGFPSTAFYDSRGRLVYTRTGGYATESQLAADISRYAR